MPSHGPHLAHDTPTPGALPTINDATKVRSDLGTIMRLLAAGVSLAIAAIGLSAWLTTMYVNQNWIMDVLKELRADVRELKAQAIQPKEPHP